ncbi:MAG: hypothetical protein ABI430_01285 [Candidatus Taylorbacteria bacterium]
MKNSEIEKILKPYNDEIKQHIDTLNKRSDEDMRRYVGSLTEDFQDKVKVVAEQYTDIMQTLGKHTKILDKHSEILDNHTKTLDKHSETLAKHSEILGNDSKTHKSHTEMIGNLAIDMTIVKSDVKTIKESLKTKVDRKEFVGLEKRVSLFELK